MPSKLQIMGFCCLVTAILLLSLIPLSTLVDNDNLVRENNLELTEDYQARDFVALPNDEYLALVQRVNPTSESNFSVLHISTDGQIHSIQPLDHPPGFSASSIHLTGDLITIPFINGSNLIFTFVDMQGRVQTANVSMNLSRFNLTSSPIHIMQIRQLTTEEASTTFAIQYLVHDRSKPCRTTQTGIIFVHLTSPTSLSLARTASLSEYLDTDSTTDVLLCQADLHVTDIIKKRSGGIALFLSHSSANGSFMIVTELDPTRFEITSSAIVINNLVGVFVHQTATGDLLLYKRGGYSFIPEPSIVTLTPDGRIVDEQSIPSAYNFGSPNLVGAVSDEQWLILLTRSNWLVLLDNDLSKIWEYTPMPNYKIGIVRAEISPHLSLVMVGNEDTYSGSDPINTTIIFTTIEFVAASTVLVQIILYMNQNRVLLAIPAGLVVILSTYFLNQLRKQGKVALTELYPRQL